MKELSTRFLALLLTAAAFVVILPVALKLLFTLGPVGFIVMLFVLFALGATYLK